MREKLRRLGAPRRKNARMLTAIIFAESLSNINDRSDEVNFSMFRLAPMDGPGTVTWEEFLENAERFLVISDKISDAWELRGDKVHRVSPNRLLARITR